MRRLRSRFMFHFWCGYMRSLERQRARLEERRGRAYDHARYWQSRLEAGL